LIHGLKGVLGKKGYRATRRQGDKATGQQGYRLQAAGCRLQATGYRLQATGYRRRIPDTRYPIPIFYAFMNFLFSIFISSILCRMKLRFLISGLVLVMVNCTLLVAQKDSVLTVVHPDKARLELATDPTSILIDVRMKMEFRKKHIEGAVNLPGKKDLDEFCAKTGNYRPLYVYCTTETRARQAAKLLIGNGFTNVFILEGGLSKWVSLNLPTVKGRGKGSRF